MTEFLMIILAAILAMLAMGLVRVLRGPGDADRMMAAQLIGTCGIAALLLIGTIGSMPAAIDVALVLALLATFASAAFTGRSWQGSRPKPRQDTEGT
jgi:multicomponent Na+:H+ antiporter subunit F